MIGSNPDDWNDDLILQSFHSAIKRHRKGSNNDPISHGKAASDKQSVGPERPISIPAKQNQNRCVKPKVTFDNDHASGTSQGIIADQRDVGPTSADAIHFAPSVDGVKPMHVSPAMLEDAQNAMLMAWYQSGYATGRYQTLCEIYQTQPSTNGSSEQQGQANITG